jgi:hypothetical protein
MNAPNNARAARRVATIAFALLALARLSSTGIARADTNQQVLTDLSTHDVYISDVFYQHHLAARADLDRLQSAVYAAANRGVTQKIALVWRYPSNIHTAAEGAAGIRDFLDLQGTLVLVSPHGMGLSSSGDLSDGEGAAIARRAWPRCAALGFSGCAVYASQLAATQARANQSSDYRNAAIFWAIALGIFGLIVAGVVLWTRRRHVPGRQFRLDDLRAAADATLRVADAAAGEIAERPEELSHDARRAHQHALGLRNRALAELEDFPGTPESLIQANEDAAEAALELREVIVRLESRQDDTRRPNRQDHRCLYCGRDDRPPYLRRPIEDGKGRSLSVDICDACTRQLRQGSTPATAATRYESLMLPWWAVPNDPFYQRYGGPGWQHWLPFFIGINVGGWFQNEGATAPTPTETSGRPAGASQPSTAPE